MGASVKTNTIKFCPFCGGDIVSHVEDDIMVCGYNDVEKEAQEKVKSLNSRCNRSFRVMRNLKPNLEGDRQSGEFRRAIGHRVANIREVGK